MCGFSCCLDFTHVRMGLRLLARPGSCQFVDQWQFIAWDSCLVYWLQLTIRMIMAEESNVSNVPEYKCKWLNPFFLLTWSWLLLMENTLYRYRRLCYMLKYLRGRTQHVSCQPHTFWKVLSLSCKIYVSSSLKYYHLQKTSIFYNPQLHFINICLNIACFLGKDPSLSDLKGQMDI